MLFNAKSLKSLKSLFSQKKGTIYRLVLLLAIVGLVVGVLFVFAAHSRTVTLTPKWAGASVANQSYNVTISNAGADTINLVRITKPTNFVDIYCLNAVTGGWTCETNGTKSLVSYVEFTGGTIASGSSESFNVSATPPSSAGEQSFTVKTDDGSATVTTNVNASIDTLPPKLSLMNVSDGTRILSGGAHLDGLLFLSNSTGKVTILFNATDNESGIASVRLYYNATNVSDGVIIKPHHNDTSTYDAALAMSNGSFGPGTLWNATLDGNFVLNGTRIVFTVVANDTVRNGNVSNYTATVSNSDRVYNFTIDSAAPRFGYMTILNYSELTTNTLGSAINTTSTVGSTVEYILNSTLLLNLSATVSDGGGSGVVRVEVMNGSGVFFDIPSIATGSNGSGGSSTWNVSLVRLNNLTRPNLNGDGLYNITFRITDNVSNVVITNVSVEVDDTPPQGSVASNITTIGLLSEGNASQGIPANESVALKLRISNNIVNNVTTVRNISVFGNLGRIFNFTYESGTLSTTSVWNLTVVNITRDFCDILAVDTSQCNLRFNFSDIMARYNDTINMTIAVDTLAPNVTIVAPVSLTTNYSTSVLINVSINDTVGPMRNVSFRWKNVTAAANDVLQGDNVSNWMPLSLSTGNNSQFNTIGYWTATLTISSLLDGAYTIEINATDSSGRVNVTQNVSNVIFDSTRPYNVSFQSPASNSFHRANTTFTGWTSTNITVVANETNNTRGNQSGILNVSFRLENSSFNWPWVRVANPFSALALGTLFSPDTVNLTHWGGELTNATNGNFTIRVNVTDTAGNQNTSVTINLTIDTVAPSVTFITPINNLNQTGNFTINVTVTESNVNTVQYRWVNQSNAAVNDIIANRSAWLTMTRGTATTFNASFRNLTDGYSFLEGNYSIELNVTDSAGNQNASVFVQLILDKNAPLVGAAGTRGNSNLTGVLSDSNFTGNSNFVVNLTINDTSTWNMQLGKIATTNINGSAFRLENATFNSSWYGMAFPTADITNTDSNRTNATFTFTSVANGLYNIRFMVNDTAGNQNNSVLISRVMLDNVTPGVALSVLNLTPRPSGGVGISGALTFNVTVTDNLPVNISFGMTTSSDNANASTQGSTFGVFYRFVSASTTTAWLPMSTTSFPSAQAPHDRIVFNATNTTSTLADGDYRLEINATDSAGNQNTSVYVDITVQNGASSVEARNLTFLEGFWNGFGNSSTGSYTFLLNTTANATCLYSLNNPKTSYSDFGPQTLSNTMSNNVSKAHRVSFGSQSDVASGGNTLYYVCKDVSGNYTAAAGVTSQLQFGIDTRNRWNVTVPGKTDNKWPNYFQPAAGGSSNGWSSFVLATGALEGTTLASAVGGYNVTNVLTSLLSGTGGNFSRVYAYTASSNSWETFVVARTSNSFINFTNQTTYWINVTAAERLEIN